MVRGKNTTHFYGKVFPPPVATSKMNMKDNCLRPSIRPSVKNYHNDFFIFLLLFYSCLTTEDINY